MTSYTAFTVTVPEMGAVTASFTDAKTISVQATRALLHEGLLYSLNGTLGVHGDAWYPISGFTATGQLGKNAPKRVADPISEAVTSAVNAHLADNPEIVSIARQEIYDAQTKYLEKRVEDEQRYLKSRINDADRAQKALDDHLKAKP